MVSELFGQIVNLLVLAGARLLTLNFSINLSEAILTEYLSVVGWLWASEGLELVTIGDFTTGGGCFDRAWSVVVWLVLLGLVVFFVIMCLMVAENFMLISLALSCFNLLYILSNFLDLLGSILDDAVTRGFCALFNAVLDFMRNMVHAMLKLVRLFIGQAIDFIGDRFMHHFIKFFFRFAI